MENLTGSSRPRRSRPSPMPNSSEKRMAALHRKLAKKSRQRRRRIQKLEREVAREEDRRGQALRRRSEAVVLELLEAARSEAALIESALRRISDRSFDCCMRCGATISIEQLELFPYSVNCQTCAADFPMDYTENLRGQHLRIRDSLDTLAELIEAASERGAAPSDVQADREVTVVVLEDLDSELREHFALEERDGYLAEATRVAPHLHRQASALLAQHGAFCDQLAAMLGPVREVGPGEQVWADLAEQFGRFASELREHERAEGELISRAHGEDLGGTGD
jgi:RNA polymerase-binding transcription factor DksA